ncbi:hypothetical protein EJ04DRAFT_511094 [Polyplosphaeria fusca]|uniref:Uncharacterized protein n=1 Tax=Polyplosphaeria fusca TaxID=682080 RepID=A0A9P4R3U7_9PLEO|nr:hypothetical protein EJ04DRAFT_511094 [Polyplosphaeria fusca]
MEIQRHGQTINERALLKPMELIAHDSNLEIIVSLPKLHPGIETLERHCTEEGSPAPFEIRRRMRQRSHTKETDGKLGVVHVPDFSFLLDLVDFRIRYTLEEVESSEREMWKNGRDVEKDVDEFLNMLRDRVRRRIPRG